LCDYTSFTRLKMSTTPRQHSKNEQPRLDRYHSQLHTRFLRRCVLPDVPLGFYQPKQTNRRPRRLPRARSAFHLFVVHFASALIEILFDVPTHLESTDVRGSAKNSPVNAEDRQALSATSLSAMAAPTAPYIVIEALHDLWSSHVPNAVKEVFYDLERKETLEFSGRVCAMTQLLPVPDYALSESGRHMALAAPPLPFTLWLSSSDDQERTLSATDAATHLPASSTIVNRWIELTSTSLEQTQSQSRDVQAKHSIDVLSQFCDIAAKTLRASMEEIKRIQHDASINPLSLVLPRAAAASVAAAAVNVPAINLEQPFIPASPSLQENWREIYVPLLEAVSDILPRGVPIGTEVVNAKLSALERIMRGSIQQYGVSRDETKHQSPVQLQGFSSRISPAPSLGGGQQSTDNGQSQPTSEQIPATTLLPHFEQRMQNVWESLVARITSRRTFPRAQGPATFSGLLRVHYERRLMMQLNLLGEEPAQDKQYDTWINQFLLEVEADFLVKVSPATTPYLIYRQALGQEAFQSRSRSSSSSSSDSTKWHESISPEQLLYFHVLASCDKLATAEDMRHLAIFAAVSKLFLAENVVESKDHAVAYREKYGGKVIGDRSVWWNDPLSPSDAISEVSFQQAAAADPIRAYLFARPVWLRLTLLEQNLYVPPDGFAPLYQAPPDLPIAVGLGQPRDSRQGTIANAKLVTLSASTMSASPNEFSKWVAATLARTIFSAWFSNVFQRLPSATIYDLVCGNTVCRSHDWIVLQTHWIARQQKGLLWDRLGALNARYLNSSRISVARKKHSLDAQHQLARKMRSAEVLRKLSTTGSIRAIIERAEVSTHKGAPELVSALQKSLAALEEGHRDLQPHESVIAQELSYYELLPDDLFELLLDANQSMTDYSIQLQDAEAGDSDLNVSGYESDESETGHPNPTGNANRHIVESVTDDNDEEWVVKDYIDSETSDGELADFEGDLVVKDYSDTTSDDSDGDDAVIQRSMTSADELRPLTTSEVRQSDPVLGDESDLVVPGYSDSDSTASTPYLRASAPPTNISTDGCAEFVSGSQDNAAEVRRPAKLTLYAGRNLYIRERVKALVNAARADPSAPPIDLKIFHQIANAEYAAFNREQRNTWFLLAMREAALHAGRSPEPPTALRVSVRRPRSRIPTATRDAPEESKVAESRHTSISDPGDDRLSSIRIPAPHSAPVQEQSVQGEIAKRVKLDAETVPTAVAADAGMSDELSFQDAFSEYLRFPASVQHAAAFWKALSLFTNRQGKSTVGSILYASRRNRDPTMLADTTIPPEKLAIKLGLALPSDQAFFRDQVHAPLSRILIQFKSSSSSTSSSSSSQ